LRLASFLEKHSLLVAAALVVLASLRIAATYPVFNHTIDEPAHIACGMEWLDKHTYRLEPHHPPLARVIETLGPYLAGARSQGGEAFYQDNPFHQGALVLYTGGHYDRYLLLARLGVLPFFWIAALSVYWWSKEYFGRLAAALAVFLLTFLPPILAHAGLATNDMAVTAFVGAAFVSMLAWSVRPNLGRSLLVGISVACAVLSKFTALAFVPVSFAAAFIWYVATRRPSAHSLILRLRALALPFGIALAAGAFTIWSMYRFSFGFAPLLGFRVPAPEFFAGIQGVLALSQNGSPAYLLGQHSPTGWWYYFPVVLAIKTPLAFLALLAIGGVICIQKDTRKSGVYTLPLVFSLSLLLLSLFAHVNTGVRYILPVYLGVCITAAIGLGEVLSSPRIERWSIAACGFLVAWLALSSALIHPDYIAYYNLLAGDEPEKVIADSDLDWGQDTNRVGKRLQELGVRQVAFAPFILADLRQHGWPAVTKSDPWTPAPGWNVVSITVWKVARMGLMLQHPDTRLWPDTVKPTERVGKGMLLYYFPPARSQPAGPARQ
jgi:4-amino-4-deoxy-L-arabinose transferase-like glycosyltransferase